MRTSATAISSRLWARSVVLRMFPCEPSGSRNAEGVSTLAHGGCVGALLRFAEAAHADTAGAAGSAAA